MAARIGRARPVSAYRPLTVKQFTPTIPGDISMTLSPITMDFTGTPTPPSGTLDTTLSPITITAAGITDTGGTASMTLGNISATFNGAVNPAGAIGMTLNPISIAFVTETVPFGEHVIKVLEDDRYFRVIDEDPGLIDINRADITDA